MDKRKSPFDRVSSAQLLTLQGNDILGCLDEAQTVKFHEQADE